MEEVTFLYEEIMQNTSDSVELCEIAFRFNWKLFFNCVILFIPVVLFYVQKFYFWLFRLYFADQNCVEQKIRTVSFLLMTSLIETNIIGEILIIYGEYTQS